MSRHHHSEYGQSWSIAAALLDNGKSFEELERHYRTMSRRFGIYMEFMPGQKGLREKHGLADFLGKNLERLIKDDWIVRDGDYYALTGKGRTEAETMLSEVEKGGKFLTKATDPEQVSRVTIAVHGLLALVKLPAAILSGSVGLLNDGLDTLLDSVSSVLVHWGIRKDRERLVSGVLLIFMMATGLYSFIEAVRGLIAGSVPEPDFLAFGAMALSALLCGGLWFYQKFSGLKHQSLPLLTQSLDSLNHVIVAGGVTVGLIASLFHIPYLDSAVGLIVALLILKGAAELLATLIRSRGEEELDLSAYGFTGYERHRRRQLESWLLHQADQGEFPSWDALRQEAFSSLDFQKIPVYRALGIAEGGLSRSEIEEVICDIRERDLLTDGEILRPTDKGRVYLRENLGRSGGFSRRIRIFGNLFFSLVHLALFGGIYLILNRLQGFLPPGPGRPFMPDVLLVIFLCAGAVLYLAGGFLRRHSSRLLHRSRLNLDKPDPSFLVTDGLYRRVRHPLYAGMLLTGWGIGFSLASIYGLGIALFCTVLNLLNAYGEDRKLVKALPGAYGAYRMATPRLIAKPLAGVLLGLLLLGYGIGLFWGYSGTNDTNYYARGKGYEVTHGGTIYLYGESHGNEKILQEEFVLWQDCYGKGMRHLFVELPYYTAEYLNLWLEEETDDILLELFDDSAGTASDTPSSREFYRNIKEHCPETVFHGTDVGHQYKSTGSKYLAYLEQNDLTSSWQYVLTQEAINQGRTYYGPPKDHLYRENMMVANFIREISLVGNEDIMGIYGNAHTGLSDMNFTKDIPNMANQLKTLVEGEIISTSLSSLAKEIDPIRTDEISIGGKTYRALYYGKDDLKGFRNFSHREFWLIENGYDDFKSCRKTKDVLPYNNYPMKMDLNEMYMVEYTDLDGESTVLYYITEGKVWDDRQVSENIRVD